MALTKDVIIDKLVAEYNLVRREATDLVDTFFDDIKGRVSNRERVKLIGLGAFFLKTEPYHRKRRNIDVDEDTPKWEIPSFTSSQKLRARIQNATRVESKDVD